MTEQVRSQPCSSCPYRRDCPSGVWAEDEYEKLRRYDEPTWAQPTAAFGCHATPEHPCHGWAVVHGDDLLALRLLAAKQGEGIVIPEPGAELFGSGNEAADYGMEMIDDPDADAVEVQERLLRKYPRLRRKADA